jgi:hypothetical protein
MVKAEILRLIRGNGVQVTDDGSEDITIWLGKVSVLVIVGFGPDEYV